MKLRGKLLLIQAILFAGFIFANALTFYRYNATLNLFEIETTSTELMENAAEFQRVTEMIPYREQPVDELVEDWQETLRDFDNSLNAVINMKGISRLDPEIETEVKNLRNAWYEYNVEYITKYSQTLAAVNFLDTQNVISDRGIQSGKAILEYQNKTNTELYTEIVSLITYSNEVNVSLNEFIIVPVTEIQSAIVSEISLFLNRIRLSSLIIAAILLLGGAIGGFYFSGTITNNIKIIENTISDIAKGNFDIQLTIKSDDEFGILSNHFNTLSSELWGRLDALKDIMQDIASSIEVEKEVDLDRFYDYILELAIDSTGAEAGIILTPDEEDPQYLAITKMVGLYPMPLELPTRVQADEDSVMQYYKAHPIRLGKTPYGLAAAKQTPLFIKNNEKERELEYNLSKTHSMTYIQSSIIIPLVASRKLLGVLALCHRTPDSFFSDLDFAYMRAYGDFIALTNDTLLKYLELLKKHELTREIEVAADIQKSLLPEKMPKMKHCAVAAYSYAAKGVSGDYYDAFQLDENRQAVIVCDVSGKGVPASLLMIMIRTVLRTVSSPEKNASRTLTELNRAITGRLGADRFATVGFFIFDQKKMEVSYSNGAHYPLYIYRAAEKKFRAFDTDGLPLGIDINAAYGHKRIKVQPNDYLLLFTDGLPEARNPDGAELGAPKLLKFISVNADMAPDKLSPKVKKFIDRFVSTAKQHDDETFLCFKVI